ncbi:hypothetical protein H0H87_005356 [Tephrocybe sp. NHM501043]|nr:hypothetical protein H0H87_005356 [Tephrocybe sp. NHM501043]
MVAILARPVPPNNLILTLDIALRLRLSCKADNNEETADTDLPGLETVNNDLDDEASKLGDDDDNETKVPFDALTQEEINKLLANTELVCTVLIKGLFGNSHLQSLTLQQRPYPSGMISALIMDFANL